MPRNPRSVQVHPGPPDPALCTRRRAIFFSVKKKNCSCPSLTSMHLALCSALLAVSLAVPIEVRKNATALINPHTAWIAVHGSLEGCCGCDCHCASCGGACPPCYDAPVLPALPVSNPHQASSTTKQQAVSDVTALNPHMSWILEHGSLEGCCGCDCHCASCGGACTPCGETAK